MTQQIITSLLDTDLYKFTMQQGVLELFPRSVVTYRFKNRGDQRFNVEFLRQLQEQIRMMSQIQLSSEEYSWIKEKIPFFKPWYLEYLRNYRFDPSEIEVYLKDNDLAINISGTWASTILWEVPLMALISELYFKTIDKEWDGDMIKVYNTAIEKSAVMESAKATFADFGTRRRRSHKIQDQVIEGLKYHDSFVGTSNVYFAMKHNLKPIGTMAHEWLMGMSVLEGLRNCNYYSLHNWVRVYNADLGIALTDTYGTPAFFKNFNLRLAKLYDGVRHDSGCAFIFTDAVVAHYKKLGIDPMSKIIVFSDGLNVHDAVQIKEYCKGRIRCSFGIGTHLTNDFEDSKALNMVIKLWSCEGVPVVKLSDSPGKVMGDPDAVKVAQWTFDEKPLPDVKKLEDALGGFLEIQQHCKELNIKDYGRYQTALDEKMKIAKELISD